MLRINFKLYLLCFCFFQYVYGIYVPEGEPKSSYSSGVKSSEWKRPSNVQFHHNYSKVVVHGDGVSNHQTNGKLQNLYDQDQKLYPIYNGHSYGGNTASKPERETRKILVEHSQNTHGAIYKVKKEISKPIEVYSKCPEGVTGQFVYDLSCNQFLNCWKGHGHVQTCAPGTLFNPKILECDFPQKVECITGPRVNSIREVRQRNIQQISCPKEFTGLIPDYKDCKKFINCNNGIETSLDCPPGTLFDITKNICNFPYLSKCFNGENENQKFGTNLQTQSGYVANHYDGQGQFSHSSGSNFGRYSNANQQYYQTTYGQSGQQSSQYGQNQHSDNSYFQSGKNFNYGNDNKQTGTLNHNIHEGQYTGQSNYNSNGINNQQNIGKTYICDGNTCRITEQNSQRTPQNSGYNEGHSGGHQQSTHGNQGVGGSSHNQHIDYNTGTTNIAGSNHKNIQCPQGAAGLHEHPFDCSKFLNCANGQTFVQDCAPGTLFNPALKNCDFPYNVKCNQNNREFVETTTYYYNNQASNYGKNINNKLDWGEETSTEPRKIYDYNRGQIQGGSSNSNYNGHGQTNQNGVYGGHKSNGPNEGQYQSGQQGGNNRQQINQGGSSNANYNNQGQTYPNGIYGGHKISGQNEGQYQNGQQGGNSDNNHQQTGQYEGQSNSWSDINTGSTGKQENYSGGYTILNGYNQQGYHAGQDQSVHYNGQNRQEKNNQNGQQNINTNLNWNDQRLESQGSIPVQVLTPRPATTGHYITKKPSYNQGTSNNHVQNRLVDYEDIVGTNRQILGGGTDTFVEQTLEKSWPPPFPSTDLNADYVFEYEDGESVTLQAENADAKDKNKNYKCEKGDYHCSSTKCIKKTAVCDGVKDCLDGGDESDCKDFTKKFTYYKNSRLAVLEKERWNNVSVSTCALMCLESHKFQCKSFNYRKIDRSCFLTNSNIGETGALVNYNPCEYYELKTTTLDCKKLYKCPNNKCINHNLICNGEDDCGDRTDEKNCKAEDLRYSIKITGSKKKNEGRIEVSALGKTGFICDDTFNTKNADVVCKELGFSLGAAEVKKNSYFSTGLSDNVTFYMMDDVNCVGNESSLRDCDFAGWGVHNCLGQEVVGVVCKTKQEKCPKDYWSCKTGHECLPLPFVCDGLLDCTDNSDEGDHCDALTELRLVNGSSSNEGRLVVKHHGIWGTVCDDDFNEDAAKVVCRALGFRGAGIVKKDGYFGAGEGPIWLDQVYCYGNESALDECSHWDWGEHNCEHSEDVGLICSNDVLPEFEGNERKFKQPKELVNSPIFPQTCGLRKDNMFRVDDDVHFRVVKGSKAKSGDYPWQAALKIKHKSKPAHWCGAVIISERFVLTAAHCLVGYAKGAYIVVVGDYNVDDEEGTEQSAYIDDFYIHEEFRKGHKMNNDIALVKLKGHGFTLNDDVQAICLPNVDVDYERNLNCTISGYGSIESGKSSFSHDLRAGWIPIQSSEICKMPHVYGDFITDGMICAGSLEEGIDACDGDSGGPLACLDNGVFTLYGIISWGQHCGFANKPGVYVKVAHYRNWIDQKMRIHS